MSSARKRDPSAREYPVPVRVEFEDVDGYRIAHHTKLVAYLERARVAFFRELGLDVFTAEAVPVLSKLEVRFRKPALFCDALEVCLTVRDVTEYQLELGYLVRRDGETLARAMTSLAFSNIERQQLEPLPDPFRAALLRWREGG